MNSQVISTLEKSTSESLASVVTPGVSNTIRHNLKQEAVPLHNEAAEWGFEPGSSMSHSIVASQPARQRVVTLRGIVVWAVTSAWPAIASRRAGCSRDRRRRSYVCRRQRLLFCPCWKKKCEHVIGTTPSSLLSK